MVDEEHYHLINAISIQSVNAKASWLSPGCTVLSKTTTTAPTDAWHARNEALLETLGLISDVVVLSVTSHEDKVTKEMEQALERGWQRRKSQGLPPGRLWIVWTGDEPAPPDWIENEVLQEWTDSLPVADWQLLETKSAYQRAVSDLGRPTSSLVSIEGLPSLIRQVYASLGGSDDPLVVNDNVDTTRNVLPEKEEERVEIISPSRVEVKTAPTLSATQLGGTQEASDGDEMDDHVDESVLLEMEAVQALLDEYWLTEPGAGLTLPPDLVKALPSKLPRPSGLLFLLEQHAQILRDYYGRLYESLLESGRATGAQALQSLSKQYQAAASRVMKHVGLTKTSVYEPSYQGLQEDFAEINDRWQAATEVLFEDENSDEDERSSKTKGIGRRIPPWLRRLGVRLLVIGVNYLQGWLAWQSVQRAALEREESLPKFPLF